LLGSTGIGTIFALTLTCGRADATLASARLPTLAKVAAARLQAASLRGSVLMRISL